MFTLIVERRRLIVLHSCCFQQRLMIFELPLDLHRRDTTRDPHVESFRRSACSPPCRHISTGCPCFQLHFASLQFGPWPYSFNHRQIVPEFYSQPPKVPNMQKSGPSTKIYHTVMTIIRRSDLRLGGRPPPFWRGALIKTCQAYRLGFL